MRIGELAGMIGLSTRAIRHYHHRGLLPEPDRLANGYREYGLRDVILLARIRRLTELGLSLDEVRGALSDEHGNDLREALIALDSDLEKQEEVIRARRARLADLIAQVELRPDSTISVELAGLLADLPAPHGEIGTLDRELLALLDITPGRDEVVAMLRANPIDPGVSADLARRLEELSDAPVDDPRITPLAHEIARSIPVDLMPTDIDMDNSFAEAVLESLKPAQAEMIRQAIRKGAT
ncbi:MerR family transcriptional regulator [Kibdelosporangium philippinense]|uniref:MerR family transcriptional regulator n=1 Tax=Kibdelosporangium philippinense TaxID=211113 RepID=A0ABS8Z0T2_9PSEU|nr:MerR family transcriptional regulator [Kibdelosporangium philippinense]MCE7001568.1 MerR family transcriptional regulator [Kibdelosporangium philippinense]